LVVYSSTKLLASPSHAPPRPASPSPALPSRALPYLDVKVLSDDYDL